MSTWRLKAIACSLACVVLTVPVAPARSATTGPAFTVEDEIGFELFGDPYTFKAEPFLVSPDGKYFAVYTEHGNLESDEVVDTLRLYRRADVEKFVLSAPSIAPPVPFWTITAADRTTGPVVTSWRWLPNSSGMAFLQRNSGGGQQLALADVATKRVSLLTDPDDFVRAFDIRDRTHFAYAVADVGARAATGSTAPASAVLTGRSVYEMLAADAQQLTQWQRANWIGAKSHVVVQVDARKFRIEDHGDPIVLDTEDALALSPDGKSLVTSAIVQDVPSFWAEKYPPPIGNPAYKIPAGQQANVERSDPVSQFVRIDLATGALSPLTDAPTGSSAGWFSSKQPSWSRDGRRILLPGTFIGASRARDSTNVRPCVAVVDAAAQVRECVADLSTRTDGGLEKGSHYVVSASFADDRGERVRIKAIARSDSALRVLHYNRTSDGAWHLAGQELAANVHDTSWIRLEIAQGMNEPPRLLATYRGRTRVIFDPNPQASRFDWTRARVDHWKDETGREWRGGLFLPSAASERPYPLVIQTHGFSESEFRPSGVYPTAFAARALASAGIAVLQVDDSKCPAGTPGEAECALSGYTAAIKHLSAAGIADSRNVGIIGFSRTCFYVLEALINSPMRFKAASITDGVTQSYSGYLLGVDTRNGTIEDSNNVIGAPPFGQGLARWIERSPEFSLHKVDAPLLIVANGRPSALFMWGQYAGLRLMKKPVEFMMLDTTEHVLRRPTVRLASQGTSVDWFRFWLLNERDSDPGKAAQYERWSAMRSRLASPPSEQIESRLTP